MEQGSDEWFAFRKGKLTASQFDKIVSSKAFKLARIIKTASADDLAEMSKRAKKQLEVYNQLMDGELETRLLNGSGLKGLVDKKLVSVYEDYKGCSLLEGASESHIESILGEAHYPGDDLPAFTANAAMERGTKLEPIARTDFEFKKDLEVREVGFIVNHDISPHIGCSPDGLVGKKSGVEFKCPLPSTHLSYHRMGGLPSKYKAQVHGCMAMAGAESWWFYSYCPGFKEFALLVERDAYTENLLKCLKQFDGIYRDKKTEITKLITE